MSHFYTYAPEQVPYAQKRYLTESKRLLAVLETQLSLNTYVAEAEYSIADMALLPWIEIFLERVSQQRTKARPAAVHMERMGDMREVMAKRVCFAQATHRLSLPCAHYALISTLRSWRAPRARTWTDGSRSSRRGRLCRGGISPPRKCRACRHEGSVTARHSRL